MIQRIQTLYILLAAIVIALIFFFPMAEMANNNGTFYIFRLNGLFEQTSKGEVLLSPSPAAVAFICINILLCIMAILAFKNRIIQIRLCVFNIILLFCTLGVFYFYIAVTFSKFSAIVNYKVFAFLPLIAIVLNYMAIRAIQKDEDLIKSIDRIR
jgi:hypothetical protein